MFARGLHINAAAWPKRTSAALSIASRRLRSARRSSRESPANEYMGGLPDSIVPRSLRICSPSWPTSERLPPWRTLSFELGEFAARHHGESPILTKLCPGGRISLTTGFAGQRLARALYFTVSAASAGCNPGADARTAIVPGAVPARTITSARP